MFWQGEEASATPTATFEDTYLRECSSDLTLKQDPSLWEGSQELSLVSPGFQGKHASPGLCSVGMELCPWKLKLLIKPYCLEKG